jgi:hypothetical protein
MLGSHALAALGRVISKLRMQGEVGIASGRKDCQGHDDGPRAAVEMLCLVELPVNTEQCAGNELLLWLSGLLARRIDGRLARHPPSSAELTHC